MTPKRRRPSRLAALFAASFVALPASAQPAPPAEAPGAESPVETPIERELETGPETESAPSEPPSAEPAPARSTSGSPPSPTPPAPAPNPLEISLGPVTLAPSLQVWSRGEVRANDYLSGENLHFVVQRARVGLSASIGYATAFVQVQDARTFGQAPPGVDGPSFGLHQGYVDLHRADVGYVRLGRQEVNYGTQRMIGALDWTAAARSFDGLRLHGTFGKLVVDLFGAYVSPRTTVPQGVLPPPAMPAGPFPGQYLATGSIGVNVAPAFQAEAYYLSRHDEGGELHVYSPGLRVWGAPIRGLTYDAEAYVQLGERGVADAMGVLEVVDHLAYAAAGDVFFRAQGTAGFGVEAGASLGSGPSADGDVDTFDNFYPTNHKFYGYMDLFSLRNLVDGHLGASLAPAGTKLSLGLRGFVFAQQRTGGPWINATGAVIGAAGANASDERLLGVEADLFLTYEPTSYLRLSADYSLFAPGSAAEAFGQDAVQQWAFVWVDFHTP